MTERPTRTRDGEIWEVFAGVRDEDPLCAVGTVSAPNPELAGLYARTLYDEWGWSRMILVSRREIFHLKEPE